MTSAVKTSIPTSPSSASSRARFAWVISLSLATALGTTWGLVEPRGPVTGAQAVLVMVSTALLGWLGGRWTASRAAAALLPPAFLLGFELARRTSSLPTVAPFDPGSEFGLLAIVLGRGVPWLLAGVPLVVGAWWGSRRVQPRRPVALVAVSAALALLAGWLVVPPLPDPVHTAGGFAELVPVELGGHRQWIEIRGTDRRNPVLLYLSGGPGQSDLAFSRVILEPLLDDVTIVGWDQRGTGKSYAALDEGSLTLDRAVDDVVELARHLTLRFGQPRVYLLGESWGSILGVLAAQRAPELFAAYIASGQMVDVLETDTAIYTDLISAAMRNGDGTLVAELATLGPPPYPSVFDYGRIMTLYPLLEGSYSPPREYRERAAAGNVGPFGILGAEYDPIEKLNVLRGLMDMFSVMYPQLQEVDLRQSVASLDVVVIVLSGDHELAARVAPARDWYDRLRAPGKKWYALPDAGHSVAFEQAGELRRILAEDVPPVSG